MRCEEAIIVDLDLDDGRWIVSLLIPQRTCVPHYIRTVLHYDYFNKCKKYSTVARTVTNNTNNNNNNSQNNGEVYIAGTYTVQYLH